MILNDHYSLFADNPKKLFLRVMEINEMEAGMLDAVLEAFAGLEELDWTQLLELFDGDEELAAAITDILAGNGLIMKSGEESKVGLPEKIMQTQAGLALISNGGFTAKLNEPVIEVAPEPVSPQREIVFEIENKLPVESIADEPEPIIPPVEEEPLAVAQSMAAPQPEAPPATEPHPDVALHQEIAQLRFEQRHFDHSLREKDIIIENLTLQNETLGRFRIFIWVLLGLIALLIAGLIFRK